MFGRIALFVLTNILILTMFTIVSSVFGLGNYAGAYGLDYGALMVFCLVWGMCASFVSLAISRWAAKKFLGVKVINPQDAGDMDWLVSMVHNLAKAANLPAMPEVGVFQSDDVNAFATGPTKKRSLVAFSSALLSQMDRKAIEGVAAHEVAHIQNGDMVTMTLLQGVINAFVMFFARIIAHFASQSVREELSGIVRIVTIIVLQIVFGLLGSLVTAWFSRRREYRADAGAASLAGREAMVAALERLQRLSPGEPLPASMQALGIRGGDGGFRALWSTHPPLEARIKALQGFSA